MHETVRQVLYDAFKQDILKHMSEGGLLPTVDECIELAEGDIFHFHPHAMPIVLYFIMEHFLDRIDSGDLELQGIDSFIQFLDIDFASLDVDGIQFYFKKRLHPDVTLRGVQEERVAQNPCFFQDDTLSRVSYLRIVKREMVSRISSSQANAICRWLEFARAWSENDIALIDTTKSALRYWTARAAHRGDSGN